MAYAISLLPISFVVGLLWGPWLIRRLILLKIVKNIRLDGQEMHLAKQGTPTMGGWLFVLTSVAVIAALVRDPRVVIPIGGGMLAFAAFGALDDYANLKNREGMGFRVKAQLFWQLLLALAIGAALYGLFGVDTIRLPLFGVMSIGIWMVPFAALTILATTSGANLIDGLDGLAAGSMAFAFVAYLVIAAWRGDFALAGACAALVGSMMAFLWFNVNPARIFMGGTGALALGAGLATVALLSGEVLLLPIIAFLLIAEIASVIIQVAYFRSTGGKRFFRRAPIHHHFELLGFKEVNVVFRFWLIAAVCAALGLVVAGIYIL